MLRQLNLTLRTKQISTIHRNVFLRRYPASKITPQSRIERINARLPSFLHRYTAPLSTAPLSHITAFLLLHELTAIIPLLLLFTTFHYTSLQLPASLTSSAWATEGIEKFERYFRRKGWLADDGDNGEGQKGWSVGQGGMKILVEIGTAWAIVKMLLPVRLVGCVWLTPWFARVVVLPVTKFMGRFLGKAKGGVSNGTAAAKKVGTPISSRDNHSMKP